MSHAKPTLFVFIAMFALAYLPQEALPQELEDLVEEREKEEAKLQRIPGVDIPGIGDGKVTGRLRMPKGEEVEHLRISQDKKIDPATYIVGPGDAILLYVWGEWDLPYHLEVGPEGSVIIPTIGLFAVADKTLLEVREMLTAAAREQYPNVKVSVSLLGMRFFTVYLTGAVLNDGSFIVHPTTRISELIERGGGFQDELAGTRIEETVGGKKLTRRRKFAPQPAGRRSIQLVHQDGSREAIDLGMFKATGEIENNPYLRMGDVVHVPYLQYEIYVYGSVNQEGVQEFRPGDTVGTLMKLAGGKSGNAPLKEAEIWRFGEDGSETIIKLVGAEDSAFRALEDIADIPLQHKDMLFVRTRSDWQQTPTVHVHGAVGFRGRYRIAPGKTTLREVLAMAGGFTEAASLAQASVIRAKFRAIVDPELRRLRQLQAVSGHMSPEDRAYLKTKAREQKGRVTVNFERLFEANDETQNILIEGGDVVFVPEKRRTVSLSGQLRRPGLLDFEDGRPVGFYLEQAGGYTWNADKRGARLIRARTGVREKLGKNLIVAAGDELWIPEKEYRDWWGFAQSSLRTVMETLTLLILVRTL